MQLKRLHNFSKDFKAFKKKEKHNNYHASCLLSRFIMHPAQPSEARLGGVHFIFHHIQILTRLLQVELFRGYYVYCMHI